MEIKKTTTPVLILILIFVIIIVPLLIINAQAYSNSNYNEFHGNNNPKIQGFSKDDYTPIIDDEEHGLGNIEITNINFLKLNDWVGFYNFSENPEYKNYDSDISSDALNMSSLNLKFIRTLETAQSDNLNENIEASNNLIIELNETIDVKYNTSIKNLEGYLIYGPRLYPCYLIRLQVQNESSTVVNVQDGNYSIDENNFLRFNFLDFFKSKDAHNFTMHLIWKYNLTINNWQLTQSTDEDLLYYSQDQPIIAQFNYRFIISGKKFDGSSISSKIGAEDLDISLKINLPDKNSLNNHTLTLNDKDYDEEDTKKFLSSDKSVNIKFSANHSLFSVDFTADFTMKFIDPVSDTWAIDRLVEQRNIRERIYFPTIISGPTHIVLKYVSFFEATITTDQTVGNSSCFERRFTYFDANVSEFEEEIEDSLVFTENIVKKKGLRIQMPFMIKGEICPFSIKYEASEDLRVIVTDNIHMPISGLSLEVNYYGIVYGTYISKNQSQPMAPVITDTNGEFLLENVPNGNYTLKFYQNNELVMESSVSAYREINYVVTTFLHFPLWIIIFSLINCTFFGFGFWMYHSFNKEKIIAEKKKKGLVKKQERKIDKKKSDKTKKKKL